MDWLRNAYDTLDTVLTYGDVNDPLYGRIVTKYREMAHDLGRGDDFERVVAEVLETKSRRGARTRTPGD